MITVKLVRRNEEEVSLLVNDAEVATVDYDQAGWSGLEAFESGIQGLMAHLISHLGPDVIELVEDETYGSDDEEDDE